MDPQPTCPRCGADALETVRLGSARAAWLWLFSGGPLPRERQVCTRCGAQAGYGSGGRILRRRRWWHVPRDLYRVVRHRRTAVPVPVTYVATAAVGTVVGITLDLWLPVTWWWFPIGLVALVWLLFLSSAFRGHRRHESLWNELIGVVRPALRAERMQRAEAERFRQIDLPLYAVVGWTGFCFLGGSQTDGHEVTAAALVFRATADDESPDVRVETAAAGHAPTRVTQERLAYQLANMALQPGVDQDPDAWFRDVEHLAVDLSGRTWVELSLPVDGTPTSFRLLRERHAWVGIAHLGDHVVAIQAERVAPEDVALERVDDLEPYIEGWRAFLAKRRAIHGH